jgi:hypothetical protein
VEKLKRSRPSNSLKDKRREAAIGSLREASQVGEQVNESRGETLLYFVDYIRSKSSERFCEVPWAVGSHGGAGRLQCKRGRGSKLRRKGRAIDPESQGPLDLHLISCIGDLQGKAPRDCNENCDIAIRDIPISPEPSINRTRVQRFRGVGVQSIGDFEGRKLLQLEIAKHDIPTEELCGPQQELVEDRWCIISGIRKR